jgi:hypothetical protein
MQVQAWIVGASVGALVFVVLCPLAVVAVLPIGGGAPPLHRLLPSTRRGRIVAAVVVALATAATVGAVAGQSIELEWIDQLG